MKAQCALKGLRKTDLSRATCGSAKTSILADLAGTSKSHSVLAVSYLASYSKDNTGIP